MLKVNIKYTAGLALLLAVLISASFFPDKSFALHSMTLDPDMGRLNIAENMEIFEDPSGDLRFRDISSPAFEDRFQPCHDDELNIGFSPSVFWMRFRVKRPESADSWAMAENTWFFEAGKPGVSEIDLYVPIISRDSDVNGRWLVKKTGARRPAESKEVMHRTYVLKIPPNFDENRYFYIRLKSTISINLSLLLWSPAEYTYWTIPDFYGFGLIYGVILGMIIYNLALYLSLRDNVYLYYVLYMAGMFTTMQFFFGQFAAFASPSDTWLLRITISMLGANWVFAGAFCRAFLNTPVHAKWLDKILLAGMACGLIVIFLTNVGYSYAANVFNSYLSMFLPLAAIASATVCLAKGFKPAGLFLAAWAVLLVGTMLYSIGGVWIPRTFLTRYTLVIGATAESMLLSLALVYRIRLLRREKDELAAREKQLEYMSNTDGLTGLFNKRYLKNQLAREVGEAGKTGKQLSLLIMDVDDFKRYNDSYGHPEGDKVLCRLAEIIRRFARETDSACRYGGEEFVVILPGATVINAELVAERVRQAFREFVFCPRDGENVCVTVSIGIAQLAPDESADAFVKRADGALYQAKRNGKDKIISAA